MATALAADGALADDRPRRGPLPAVTGVASDSRLAGPGDLYLALPGDRTHGARFAAQAVRAGAVAVLTDAAGAALLEGDGSLGPDVPVVVVDRPRALMAGLAAEVYDRPARALRTVGITGTNGKTTTSFLVDGGLRAGGWHTGLIGTLGYRIDDRPLDGPRTTVTTPESAELQGLFAALREAGAQAVTMEVSSHALALGRADAVVFDVAVFTNFGRDHLDFHGTLEAYFAAKASLFTAARARRAVINLDDPRGPALVAQARAEGLAVVTTGTADGTAADYRLLELDADGPVTRLTVGTPAGTVRMDLKLPGDHNAHNAVSALAAVDLLTADAAPGPGPAFDRDRAIAGIGAVTVPGRMQPVPLADHPDARTPQVYVDFAHTPQAVASALAALAPRAHGRPVVCVVGCGGDRDPAKRGSMGAAAVRGADLVVITDDNPRGEEPAAIRAATLAGARDELARTGAATEVVDGGDRRSALALALRRARTSGAVVAVLGKGHEQGQEVAGVVHPFDDAAVVAELWAELADEPAVPSEAAPVPTARGSR
uniref:UDP-N-acetylmuramoyl-L-alanyl-D-glutamate--2, 6-diaminopimelate ligase n=1 Tax=Microlunatus kandeliicorticis TaxID=1759536 RepID=UPI001F38FA92